MPSVNRRRLAVCVCLLALGGMSPVPVSVDLSGVRQLSLLVDFGERGDELDYADWLEARLVP